MNRGPGASALPILLCAVAAAQFAWSAAAHAGCDRSNFKIVLDVGHSAEASGALSARGKPEFEFNLALANQVAAELARVGFAKAAVMVSAGRGRQGLMQRSARANKMGADLFLSVHHDSVQDVYLEKWTFEGRKLTFSDRYKGYSLFVSGANPQFQQSIQLATALGDALQARGLTFTTHHAERIKGEGRELIDARRGVYRFDQLVVLKNTRAPALLLEAGVIVNRDEEAQLASPRRRALVAEAAAAAVSEFCASDGAKR